MIVGIIIGSVLLLLLIIFLAIEFWIYKAFFYTPHKNQNDEHKVDGIIKLLDEKKLHAMIDKMQSIPYEDFWIKSYDGLKLHAFFYENKNSNQYVLLFNGYRGRPRRDYCSRAMDLILAGKNVVLCEQRGHGLSEGHTISLGRREQHDVVSWVKYVQERFGKDKKICVAGTSLGASTVMLASDKLPEDVKVFADSGYATEKDMVKHIIKRQKLNPNLCWPLVYIAAWMFGHVRLIDDAAVNVANSKCQVLLVHCTADTIVPMEVNKNLLSIKKDNVRVVLFENLQHALAYFKEHEKYMKMFHEYIDE